MIKFEYVEEYLEVIGGQIDPVTKKRVSNWFSSFEPIISLARYDVKVLESMVITVSQKEPLTERQAELACKIILNYRRQLASKQIDVSPVENPKWKIPLRKMDYSKRLNLANDKIAVKFPFNSDLIESIKVFTKESQGSSTWNRENKIWEIALTEYNLSWLMAWAQLHTFEIDPELTKLMTQLTQVEKTGYAIELYLVGDSVNISNAPASLLEYINNHIGGLHMDNLLHLVDSAPILGYTINKDLAQALVTEYGPRFYNLISNREIKINPDTMYTEDNFLSVIDYADGMERWPIVIFEPDLSDRMLNSLAQHRSDYIYKNGQVKSPVIDPAWRYIHTTVPIRSLESIPMLVSSAGMVFSGDKALMLQRAEKVVYCATEVYNKRNTKVKNIAS